MARNGEDYINLYERWGCNSVIAGKPQHSWRRLELRVGDYSTIILTLEEAEAVARELWRMVRNLRRADVDAQEDPPPLPRPISAKRVMSPEEREAFKARMVAGRAKKAQGIEARQGEDPSSGLHPKDESPVAEGDAP